MGLLFAIVTVLAWGTWLAPSQNVALRSQQVRTFHVALANLVLATVVAALHGFGGLTTAGFWLPFAGGLVWAVAGLCAFIASANLGMARAFGLWAPLNILVSLFCGWWWFGEFHEPSRHQQVALVAALSAILGGVALIVFARGDVAREPGTRSVSKGLLGALGAGLLWGVYFIPIRLSGVSMWIGAWPLAIGIFAGATALLLLAREWPSIPSPAGYARVASTGVLWSIGNYGMLVLVQELGAGRGFTISQLAIVVNAIVGIRLFREPPPGSRAARRTLAGCALATLGGVLLGMVKP
jgi:glucose uptake protein